MTALEVMLNLRRAGDDCARIQELIDMRRDAVTRVTAAYGEKGGSGGAAADRMSDYAARIDQLSRRLSARKRAWEWEMDICLLIADELEGIERTVLYSYYGKAWTLDAIASSAGFTPTYVRKRKVALDEQLRAREIAAPDWYREE